MTTIAEHQALVASDGIIAAVDAAIARAEADSTNAVIRVYADSARNAATQLAEHVAGGAELPLAGVPVLIKDNLCYQGHPVEACSKILDGFVAPYQATAIQRLVDAGAIIIGAANMDEFAMGSSNETSKHGPVKNPHDTGRIPGGSSGGSAAAVGGGIVPLALGSDTGGSIRQPAALCGCIGFKPSYGRVSRYGLLAFGSSLDQIGPFTRTVDDCATAFQVLSGHDPADSTSSDKPLDLDTLASTADLKGLRVGYVAAHDEGLEAGTADRLHAIRDQLEAAGADLVPIELAHERYCVAIYYIIATGEASSNLARYDGVHYGHRADDKTDLDPMFYNEPGKVGGTDLDKIYYHSRGEGFGDEVKRRIMLGTYVLSEGYTGKYYLKAMQVRARLCDDYDKAFAKCDVILGPTSPTTAFKAGEKLSDPLQMYLSDIFTIGANLAGLPSISIPAGTDQGLPIGLHLQAPQFADEKLLAISRAIEALIR